MGDRGNIAVKQHNSDDLIYLYTHWGGYRIEDDLRTALAKRQRWNDGAYLTRIIFDVMTEDQHGTETGFGISTTVQDNEYPILVVDPDTQTVSVLGTNQRWTFEEFIVKGATPL